MQSLYDNIKELTAAGRADDAVALAEAALAKGEDAVLFYLLGNAYAKAGKMGDAISAYKKAECLDANSPAHEAREMLDGIMAFYNKDLYNP